MDVTVGCQQNPSSSDYLLVHTNITVVHQGHLFPGAKKNYSRTMNKEMITGWIMLDNVYID